MYSRLQAAFAAFVFSITSMSTAVAGSKTFGPFTVDDTNPSVIALNGDIDINSSLSFRRALQAAPGAKLITLNSLGGSVQMGLLIADDIHQRKLATYIPKESKCFSACSFVFLAGDERKVDGALGVHQISSDSPDLVGAQLAISDIIEVLNRFGTPMDVMQIMFKTPPNDTHVFSQEEVAQYRLNRTSGVDQSATSVASASSAVANLNTDVDHGRGDHKDGPEKAIPAPTTPEANQQATLSPLEEFTRPPNRIAVYLGLDLFGDDISSVRVADAADCAKSCLLMNGQCKAFTFNANPKIKRGPNCFLKSSAGRADGNGAAFSGRFLSGVDADPPSFTLGTIDPQSSLFHDVDLQGGDLSLRPYSTAKTPLDCRLACVDNSRCLAFTYNYLKKQCWLKGAIGTATPGKGMVSGVKKLETFTPAKIISLSQ